MSSMQPSMAIPMARDKRTHQFNTIRVIMGLVCVIMGLICVIMGLVFAERNDHIA